MSTTPSFLSVDAGSSFFKAATHSEAIRFASMVHELPAPSRGSLEVEGKHFVCGDIALDRQSKLQAQPHQSADYHGSLTQRVLICEALNRLGGGDYDALILNLPYFMRDNPEAANRILQQSKTFEWSTQGTRHTAQMGQVKLLPQGRGAIWSHLAQVPDRSQLHLVCAVDIGGHTTDVVTLRPGDKLGQQNTVEDASHSCAVNVAWFWRQLSARIQETPGHDLLGEHFAFYTVMRAIENGSYALRHKNAVIDVRRAAEQTKKDFTARLLASVQRIVGEWWGDVDCIVLTGGGAMLVDRQVWDDGRIVVTDSLANVNGQKYLLN